MGIDMTTLSCVFGTQEELPYFLLHQAFEAHVQLHPELRAVEFEGSWLSYTELDRHATTLASTLAQLNIQVGSCVAVIMERCLEFPISLVAIQKVGGIMLPQDATLPSQRLSMIALDASVSVILTTRQHAQHIKDMSLDIPVIYVDSMDLAANPKQLERLECHHATRFDTAYILYTSGSTGKPKGVPVLHKGTTNMMLTSGRALGITPGTRVMQFMAIGFAMCQWEVWATLSYGGTVVFRGDNVTKTIQSVDILVATPTGLSLLGHPDQFSNLRCVGVVGEAVPTSLKDLWCPFMPVWNFFGASECCLTHLVVLDKDAPVTIGPTIPNVNCYILNDALAPVPLGEIGEICIGGVGVNIGYINMPELSETKFITDPFTPQGRLYRMGDLGRMSANGHVETIGRSDSQVKFKGYRIELDEIAQVMMQHPDVVSATVLLKDKSILVGFYSPSTISQTELRDFVSTYLPVYMVPSVYHALENMPQNANGKIDKKFLEQIPIQIDSSELESNIEIQMATIWATVLRLDVKKIGRYASFFALGGDSISIIQVVSLCRQQGLYITVPQLTKENLLWKVAKRASLPPDDITWQSAQLPEAILDTSEYKLQEGDIIYPATYDQTYMYRATKMDSTSWIALHKFKLGALTDKTRWTEAFKQVVAAREVLRTTFVDIGDRVYQVIHTKLDSLPANALAQFLIEFDEVDEPWGVLSLHHATYDGWSLQHILADLFDAYNQVELTPRPSFRNVIDYISCQSMDLHQEYWCTYLKDLTPTPLGTPGLEVTSDKPVEFDSAASMEVLTTAASQAGVTLAALFSYAWASALRLCRQQDDVVFGQVLSNRNIPVTDADQIIGCMICTLPCRIQFNDKISIKEHLQQIMSQDHEKYAHTYVSPVQMAEWLGFKRRTEMFDCEIVFQNLPQQNYEVESIMRPANDENLNLEIYVTPSETKLHVQGYIKTSAIKYEEGRVMLEELDRQFVRLCHEINQSS